jgi:hypothetical protein
MIRYPAVSGQFYSDDFSELTRQIERCFIKGPGTLPGRRKNLQLRGVIAPHAGYDFSGPTASWAYREIAESSFPDVFIVLGTSHSGYKTCVSLSDWKTPLGIVKNDSEFTKSLKIIDDEKAHLHEHSIEVQLPFLQFACKDKPENIRICPIMVNDPNGVAEKIILSAKKQSKSVLIIASSDFTHYGQNYSYLPFVSNIKENLHKLDQSAIRKIMKLDIEGFKAHIEKTQATICGRSPITVLMEYMLKQGVKNSRLLNYTTSGDVLNDFSNAVGYAAISFY